MEMNHECMKIFKELCDYCDQRGYTIAEVYFWCNKALVWDENKTKIRLVYDFGYWE